MNLQPTTIVHLVFGTILVFGFLYVVANVILSVRASNAENIHKKKMAMIERENMRELRSPPSKP